jgi:hypothetical protein
MMFSGLPGSVRRCLVGAVAGLVVVALSGCTGRGGGQLPPNSPVFTGAASFGFSFSCERSSKSTSPNPPTGRLAIELSYTEHGANPLAAAGFSIHGMVDTLDPVLESAICIGQNPPPDGSTLIFLGRYRATTSTPPGFPQQCATTSTCRFEVTVRDNDMNRAPSPGDYFSITLSSGTAVSSQLDPATVFYTRAGLLSSGNLTVD